MTLGFFPLLKGDHQSGLFIPSWSQEIIDKLPINPPPRCSTPIGPVTERIEEIERSFDKVVFIHPRIPDVGLDNTNYFETYQDYQYRPHYIKERDPIADREAHFNENTVRSLQNVPSPTQTDRDIILGTGISVSRGISGLSREITIACILL